jgi:hypothetical protein
MAESAIRQLILDFVEGSDKGIIRGMIWFFRIGVNSFRVKNRQNHHFVYIKIQPVKILWVKNCVLTF